MPERHLADAGSRDWLVSRLGAELASKVYIKATISQACSKASQFVTDNEKIKEWAYRYCAP